MSKEILYVPHRILDTIADNKKWITAASLEITLAIISFIASSIVVISLWKKTPVSNSASNSSSTRSRVRNRNRVRMQDDAESDEQELESGLQKSPYRRIVFGMCASDLFLSMAIFIGPFSMPKHIPNAPWGLGNWVSCTFDGIFLTIGWLMGAMYVAFICAYYKCKVVDRMKDDEFVRMEKKVHIFIISCVLATTILLGSLQIMNPLSFGTFCGPSLQSPRGCRIDPEQFGECLDVPLAKMIIYGLCLGGIILTSLGIILWHMTRLISHVHKMNLIYMTMSGNNQTVSSQTTETGTAQKVSAPLFFLKNAIFELRSTKDEHDDPNHQQIIANTRDEEKNDQQINFLRSEKRKVRFSASLESVPVGHSSQQIGSANNRESTSTSNAVATESQRAAEEMRKLYARMTLTQAFLFVGSFILCNICTLIVAIVSAAANKTVTEISPILRYIVTITNPSWGIINILIFTRPSISYFRRENPQYSWFQSFSLVLRAGGGVPDVPSSSRSNEERDEPVEDGSVVEDDAKIVSSISSVAYGYEEKAKPDPVVVSAASNVCSYAESDAEISEKDLRFRDRDNWGQNDIDVRANIFDSQDLPSCFSLPDIDDSNQDY